jgi:hypothetical protein
LAKRRSELQKLIDRKQLRSKTEFEIKKSVLTDQFGGSVKSLIRQIRRQKEVITSSYGPVVLSSKKEERPIFDINKDLDPEGAKFLKELNSQ